MRSATELQGHEAAKATTGRNEKFIGKHSRPKQRRSTKTSQNHAPDSAKHFALVGQATNDAVRDWDVRTGVLSWPQGLDALLGYDGSSADADIAFWQKQVHPQDRARTARSIRDALGSDATHWTGEYRFRRHDGLYLDLLERAVIVRDTSGAAIRFVGSLMDVTARKQQ